MITSAFRSDAEQARLFAANPDPRWVAPPGTSLHRCAHRARPRAGERLRLARRQRPRFGFLKRYAWEPWHFGFTGGPAPCSTAANGSARGDGGPPPGCPPSCPIASAGRS